MKIDVEKMPPDMRADYRRAASIIVECIRTSLNNGELNTTEYFSSALNVGFATFGCTASELATDEGMSRAAISKWVNGETLPNSVPSRKEIIGWLIRQGEGQIAKCDALKV